MPNSAESLVESVSGTALPSAAADGQAAVRVAHGHVMRDDIQLLRAVAVLSVLLYHADKHLLAGGYLGVDIFFVLSGFLITRNILKDIERGTFSYATFIARRFRRLLPACYAMLSLTVVLAAVFLTRQDMTSFLTQLTGTLTFSSNLVLWRQTGYFDASSSLKLLLHTWSLSIEEQYYLFLPPALYLGLRGGLLRWLCLLFLASLAACFLLMPYKPSAVFYLLPFRAWELLAGSLCAAWLLRGQRPSVPHWIRWSAFGILLLTLFFPPGVTHPGPGALVVVVATALLMVGAIDFGTSGFVRGLYFIGDISYSLYLVHWPLFAVANHVLAHEATLPVKLALMALSIGLAYLSFRLVEQPFRVPTAARRRKVFSLAAGVGALVLVFGMVLHEVREPAAGAIGDDNSANYGLDQACAFGDRFMARPECQSAAAPSVLLWGDSYAMHLADALTQQQLLPEEKRFGFIQATKSLCGPVPGIAPLIGAYREAWAEDCVSFNDTVEAYLSAHPEIRLVILGSKWRQYFNDEGQDGFLVSPGANAEAPAGRVFKALDPALVTVQVRSLVDRLIASGRQVLIVQPPPSADFDIHQCLQRKREGLYYVGPASACQIDQAVAASKDAGLGQLLRSLGDVDGLSRYSLETLLCDGRQCRTDIDGIALYRDEGHLSRQGSRVVGERSGLNALVSQLSGEDRPSVAQTSNTFESSTRSKP